MSQSRSKPTNSPIEPLSNVEAERRRIYALAELAGRGWAELRKRAPSTPPELEAAQRAAGKACDEFGTEWSTLLTPEQLFEGELIGQLDDLATLYEIADEASEAAAGKPQ
jgi:hypothetical protein